MLQMGGCVMECAPGDGMPETGRASVSPRRALRTRELNDEPAALQCPDDPSVPDDDLARQDGPPRLHLERQAAVRALSPPGMLDDAALHVDRGHDRNAAGSCDVTLTRSPPTTWMNATGTSSAYRANDPRSRVSPRSASSTAVRRAAPRALHSGHGHWPWSAHT